MGRRLWLVLLLSLSARSGAAQDVRQLVREHLDQELESPPPRAPQAPPAREVTPPAPAAPPPPAPAAPPPPAPEGGVSFSYSSEDAPEPPKDEGPPLPRRLFNKHFQLDLYVGGGYRGWRPQSFAQVSMGARSYYVWSVDVKAKLFRFLNLHHGYYESNALAGPRTREAAVASDVGSYIPKVAWLLGVLGFPFFKAYEPIIRYESRAFRSVARPRQPVCVVTDQVASDLSTCVRSGANLRMDSGFETLIAGVRIDHSKLPSPVIHQRQAGLPPITVGVGLMSYRKPYQVNVDGDVLEGYLFDGRFRGAGLMLGADFRGGPAQFSLSFDTQVGLGQVKLTRKLTLNALAPDDWLMGYVQGNVTLGYNWPLVRGAPTLMFVPQGTLGGASFFLFTTKEKGDQTGDIASVNWDLLWALQAKLVLTL